MKGGVGPHCSCCGTADGPFQEVGGAFALLMYRLPAARSSSGTAGLLKPPTELLAYHRPGEPDLQWGCPAVPLLDGAAMVPGGAHSGRASEVGGDLRAGQTAPAPSSSGGVPAGDRSGL